ncbi:hypothetical protein EDB83DRAFT_2322900 [Lactarius deliciosus]|nr:hypothetical protein EDB83DRAFT_2322900 [Lactarius deliciosus]
MASSSAVFSAVQRAGSPAYQGLANAILSHSGDDDARLQHLQDQRHAGILACNSVAEIIELIPDDYRVHITDHLHSAQKAVAQLCSTRSTVAKWKHHRSVGTLPAHLRGSANKVQFTAGYGETAAAKAAQKTSDDAYSTYQLACLDRDIAARELEVVFLEAAISPDKATLDMRSALAPHCASILERYKVPRDVIGPDGSVTDVQWKVNPQASAIMEATMADVGVYAHRAIAIALNIGKREDMRIEKTKSLAAAAKVAAGDGVAMDVDATLAQTIRSEVKRQVMGVMPRDKQQSRGAGPSKLTGAARGAAANVQATVHGQGTGSKKKRSGPKPQKEGYTVVAKVEGSQKKRKRRGKGKGKQQQQQQQGPKPSRKGKEKAT